jgi:poly(3-hydroxybutyrate) depolymerase
MIRSLRPAVVVVALAACPGVRAQIVDESFSATHCGARESLFRAGMEAAEQGGTRPSGGAGGGVGSWSLSVEVPDTGRTHAARLYASPFLDNAQAAPLVIALHGAAGSAAAAPGAADAIRLLWRTRIANEDALLLVPIASGAQGGWVPDWDTPALACAIAQVERRYNVDRRRRYLWGFSAGGHYGHALALANTDRLAAHAVNAGALFALACGQPASANDCAATLPGVPRRIPVALRVGDADPLASFVGGDVDRFEAAGWEAGSEVSLTVFQGGHVIGAADVDAAWAWFAGRPLTP